MSNASSTNQSRQQQQRQRQQVVVVVVRHGERLDYILRDTKNINWVQTATTQRPWDPPLTEYGHKQGKALGNAISNILKSNNLPSTISGIYSSPFLRCRQTAKAIAMSYITNTKQKQQQNQFTKSSNNNSDETTVIGSNNNNKLFKVCIEYGLVESFNENFYRSWSLPNSDSTWGFQKKELPLDKVDKSTLHPISKVPAQTLLEETMKPLLAEKGLHDGSDKKGNNDNDSDNSMIDLTYQSKTHITTPYSLHPPNFESYKMQRTRMTKTLNEISKSYCNNQTFVMVSHGGPVTHLYESLTGNSWSVHGNSKYCCYSVYRKWVGDDDDNDDNDARWESLIVNQTVDVVGDDNNDIKEEDEQQQQEQQQTANGAGATFAWS